jgi:hypothetical protein
VTKGLEFLCGSQLPAGNWRGAKAGGQGVAESLAVLAFLSAGEKPDYPTVRAAIGYLDALEPPGVYARSMRAMVYARLISITPRPQERLAGALQADVDWLIAQQHETSGGWGSLDRRLAQGSGNAAGGREDFADTQDSFAACTALCSAAAAGANVPSAAMDKCRAFWAKSPNDDGGWGYQVFADAPGNGAEGFRFRGASHGSATAGGMASLWALGAAGNTDAAAKAGKWLEQHYAVESNPGWSWGQGDNEHALYLLCMTMAMEQSGARGISGNSWYGQVVTFLLAGQAPKGFWLLGPNGSGNPADAPADTAIAIMVLCQAQRPIVLGCPSWACSPGLAPAAMADSLGDTLGRPCGWQMLAQSANLSAGRPLPLVCLPSLEAGKVTGPQRDKLLGYVRGGATIVALSRDQKHAEELATFFASLLPDCRQAPTPDGHPVWGVKFQVKAGGLVGIGDACRTDVFVLPPDVSARLLDLCTPPADSGKAAAPGRAGLKSDMELLANIVLYATDLTLPESTAPDAGRAVSPGQPQRFIDVARIKYAGNWNVGRQALPALSDVLAKAFDVGIREAVVDLSAAPKDVPLLWMTGCDGDQPAAAGPGGRLTQEQQAMLKQYLQQGGTLFIDSANGGEGFHGEAVATVKAMFGADSVRKLDAGSPILSGGFHDAMGQPIKDVAYTRCVPPADRGAIPPLLGVEVNGRLAVIISRLGVTAPMEGRIPFGCKGLATDDARRLGANIVLYAAYGQ